MKIKTTKEVTLTSDEVIQAIQAYVRAEFERDGIYYNHFTFLSEVPSVSLVARDGCYFTTAILKSK